MVATDILREDDLFQVAGVGVGVLAVGLGGRLAVAVGVAGVGLTAAGQQAQR